METRSPDLQTNSLIEALLALYALVLLKYRGENTRIILTWTMAILPCLFGSFVGAQDI
jgi:hypothetical protein